MLFPVKNRKYFPALRVLLCILYAYGTNAQHLHFRNVSVESGLISSNVYKSTEDEYGCLWISTNKGICWFDGKEFIQLPDSSGLTENSYYFGKANPVTKELWFISNNFKAFHGKRNTFSQLGIKEEVAWIDFDDEGRTWLLTRKGSIYFVSEKKVGLYTHSDLSPQLGRQISITGTLKKHCITVTTSDSIFVFQNRKKQTLPITVKEFQFGVQSCVFKGRASSFYLSTYKGLYLLDSNQQLKKLTGDLSAEVKSLYEETNGNVWVGTTKGIFRYSNGVFDGGHLQRYLQDLIVLNLFMTSEGLICASTQQDGLYFCAPEVVHYDQQDGLVQKNIMYMRKIGQTVFCIPFNGGISVIDGDKAKPYTFNNRIDKKGVIIYAAEARDNLILEQLHHRYFAEVDSFSERSVYDLGWSYAINAYFGDSLRLIKMREGYELFDEQGQLLQHKDCYAYFRPYLKEKKIRSHAEVLMYDPGRLMFYYTSQHGFITVKCSAGKPDIRQHNLGSDVSSMIGLHNGLVLAGTYNKGIAVMFRNDTSFLDTRNRLPSDQCQKLYYDGIYVWAITSKGLSRIRFNADGTIAGLSNFTGNDLLVYNEVNDVTVSGETVYVGTNNGVSAFNRHIALPVKPVLPYIGSVRINNADTAVYGSYVLSYDHNTIRVDYKLASVRSGNQVWYKYLFSDHDNDTAYTYTTNTSVEFHSLPPGTYTFSLWAKNADGEWSAEPEQIRFVITLPYWKTSWFIISVAAFIIIIFILIILYRVNERRKANRISVKLKESELRALRLHMNPHFIFNTLNSLQSFVLENKPLEANSYIAKFSRMIRWVMSFSHRSEITLQEELDLLRAYIELEQLRFEMAFEMEIFIAPEIDPGSVHIPALIIQPFVENAIRYGLAGNEKKGSLQIAFGLHGEEYIIATVSDNGVGREQVRQEQSRSPRSYTSTGISYTEERLKMLINDKKIVNTVTITDLYENGLAAGTRVEIIIPVLS